MSAKAGQQSPNTPKAEAQRLLRGQRATCISAPVCFRHCLRMAAVVKQLNTIILTAWAQGSSLILRTEHHSNKSRFLSARLSVPRAQDKPNEDSRLTIAPPRQVSITPSIVTTTRSRVGSRKSILQ